MEEAMSLLTETGTMNPDHPMLQRAQQGLANQLNAKRMRVEGELREKQNALTRAKKQREEVGVELYGYQQNLAKLQMSLESAQDKYQQLNTARQQAEQQLGQLKGSLQEQQALTKQDNQRAEIVQRELDKLGTTLRQIEAYNESMKGDIAVTRRAAYAAEEAVQKLEKEKQHQDFLIDDLQENLKSLHQQLALYSAQLKEQQHETRAAKETLTEAEKEMEGVHFEKKQLLAQWKGSLNAILRRDEALAAIQESIRAQQQQELSIDMEIQGYKKDINTEQIKNEQLSSVVRKVQGEGEFLLKQTGFAVEKQERLAAQLAKLTRSLEQTEENIKRSAFEEKALASEADSIDRATQRVFQELRALEADMLHTLSEQTSTDKSCSKMAADIRALRAAAELEELHIAEAQNELARVAVDCLNTEGHNDRLQQALVMLDAQLKEKDAAIAKCEVDLKRRSDEIERKTRDMDTLNRKMEKLLSAQPEAIATGPLEATIHNLGKEIEHKTKEGQELQRNWITKQTELVALQADNNSLTEALARNKAEVTVLNQKRIRVERALSQQTQETKALTAAATRLQVDLGRINALIAQNTGLKALLQEEHLQLEGRALSELRLLEESSAALASAIQEGQLAKRQLLDDIMEAERQIMLTERKLQLEKEMQEMLDPSVGEGVVAAMKKEVHRMELRLSELELEKALSKHEIIGMKALAQRNKYQLLLSTTQLQHMAKAYEDAATGRYRQPLTICRGLLCIAQAVIGAGAAGLAVARELLREGHDVTILEAASHIGGAWHFDNSTDSDLLGRDPSRCRVHSSMYSGLRTNLPRQVMTLLDLPFTPAALSGRSVDGRVPGMADWPGLQLHSHNYRGPHQFKGMAKVLVVGASFSGEEIARHISGVVDQLLADGGAVFEGGQVMQQLDAIVYCTGYQYSYPWLDHLGLVSTGDGHVRPLYLHMFPPAVAPSLAFIGLPWRCTKMPQFKLQGQLLARLLSGRAALPSLGSMLQAVGLEIFLSFSQEQQHQ
eukprot:gene7189-7403_t